MIKVKPSSTYVFEYQTNVAATCCRARAGFVFRKSNSEKSFSQDGNYSIHSNILHDFVASSSWNDESTRSADHFSDSSHNKPILQLFRDAVLFIPRYSCICIALYLFDLFLLVSRCKQVWQVDSRNLRRQEQQQRPQVLENTRWIY